MRFCLPPALGVSQLLWQCLVLQPSISSGSSAPAPHSGMMRPREGNDFYPNPSSQPLPNEQGLSSSGFQQGFVGKDPAGLHRCSTDRELLPVPCSHPCTSTRASPASSLWVVAALLTSAVTPRAYPGLKVSIQSPFGCLGGLQTLFLLLHCLSICLLKSKGLLRPSFCCHWQN